MIDKIKIKLVIIRLLKRLKILKKSVIYYIGGSEALPPPLSVEEEVFYLSKLEMGDSGVKTVLIGRNLRLVVYIARKFENTGIGIEDLVSIGTIGLSKLSIHLILIKKLNWLHMLQSVLIMKF